MFNLSTVHHSSCWGSQQHFDFLFIHSFWRFSQYTDYCLRIPKTVLILSWYSQFHAQQVQCHSAKTFTSNISKLYLHQVLFTTNFIHSFKMCFTKLPADFDIGYSAIYMTTTSPFHFCHSIPFLWHHFMHACICVTQLNNPIATSLFLHVSFLSFSYISCCHRTFICVYVLSCVGTIGHTDGWVTEITGMPWLLHVHT